MRLLFDLPAFDPRLLVPRYNIAPTQPIVVVRQGPTGRELVPMRWGLIPWWAKDPKTMPLMINARAESIAEKPAYRDAFRYRRCLIPASGFYEWQDRGKGPRQPYAVLPADGEPFAFAGLWETWSGPDGSEVDTAVIVTTDANQTLLPLHERMPVVLARADFETWLSPRTIPAQASAVLKPAPEDALTFRPVSTQVNAVANDDAALLDEAPLLEDAPAEPDDQLQLF